MQIVPLSLGLKSAPARLGHMGACRLINMYAEEAGPEAKYPWVLYGADGFDLFSTLTDGGAIRGIYAVSDNEALVLSGRLLFRVDSTGTATVVGGIPSDGLVTIDRNRVRPPQVAIVCDGLYFVYQGGTLTQITDADLPAATSVTSLNGYFVFQHADGRITASDLDDDEVTALSFATASANPDGGVRVWTRGQDLISFGQRSTEFWGDVGGDPFPFQRTTSIDVGLLAARSVANVDQTCAFVAHDGTVRLLNGYQAVKISSAEVQLLIAAESSADNISACGWTYRGHTFYSVSGSTWTRVYDASTGLWHERSSYALPRWRVDQAAQFGRQIIFGDYATNKLYKLNPATYTEAGNHMIATAQLPPTHAEPYRVAHHALFVDVAPGVGLVSADGSLANPSIMMDYSDNGGATWSTQRTGALGAAADYLRRVRFNRLGMARSRTYRLSISAAVPRAIGGVYLGQERGAA